MKRSLDIYDDIPKAMRNYLSHYGFHFSRKAYEYATENFASPYKEEEVDNMMLNYNITLKNDTLYDKVFVASWAKEHLLGRSLTDEQHLAMFVRDVIDDADGSGEEPFRRWISDCVGRGEPIEWYDIL